MDGTILAMFLLYDVDNIPDPVIVHAGENILTGIDCAEPEAEAKLKELKFDNAVGSDGFLSKVLKAVAEGVVPHSCQIFDLGPSAEVSLNFGRLPYPLKGSTHR